jgi:surfeit locus 1 family protein
MAAALKAPAPAPVFLMLESPAPQGPPLPSPLPTDIPNRHLEYALTWFGLALALLAVYIAKLVRDRKA